MVIFDTVFFEPQRESGEQPQMDLISALVKDHLFTNTITRYSTMFFFGNLIQDYNFHMNPLEHIFLDQLCLLHKH